MTGLARVIAGLFPHGVGTAAVTIGAALQPLRDELRAVENAVPHRRLEFAAGRAAARAAMRAAGLAEAAIPMDDDRAPIWPSGMVGSITHAEDVALAAVASLDVVAGLGLDAEPDAPLPDDVLSEICDGEECAWIAGQAQPLRWARLIFVAKEAAFKCQYPASKTIFGFDGMRIGIDVERGALTAAFRRAIPPFSEAEVLHGRFARSAGLVVAGFVRQHD